MGTMLNAFCDECGYSAKGLFFGQGMLGRHFRIPALRQDSGDMVVEVLSDDDNLRFYHQREMYKNALTKDEYGDFIGISWGQDFVLSHEGNLCPSCRKYSMSFREVGNWD